MYSDLAGEVKTHMDDDDTAEVSMTRIGFEITLTCNISMVFKIGLD